MIVFFYEIKVTISQGYGNDKIMFPAPGGCPNGILHQKCHNLMHDSLLF